MSGRILIADDDRSILETFEHHLGRSGYEVATAASAEGALEVLPAFEPALVITDVRMPGMDGIELCRQIRAASPTQNTPVLILSARGDAEAVQQGMAAGADDYLSKPILHHDLISKVRELLKMNGTG